jgi:hypothetical protein
VSLRMIHDGAHKVLDHFGIHLWALVAG